MPDSEIQETLAFVDCIAWSAANIRFHEYVDTEHFLLAVVATESSAASRLLGKMKAYPRHISVEINKRHPPGPDCIMMGGPLPHTKHVTALKKQVLEMKKEAFREFPTSVVLLIAMLRQEGTSAQSMLTSFGVTEEAVMNAWKAENA